MLQRCGSHRRRGRDSCSNIRDVCLDQIRDDCLDQHRGEGVSCNVEIKPSDRLSTASAQGKEGGSRRTNPFKKRRTPTFGFIRGLLTHAVFTATDAKRGQR